MSVRLAALEQSLIGARLDGALGDHVEDLEGLDPIDDIRGSAAYRKDAALTLVRRGLSELGARR